MPLRYTLERRFTVQYVESKYVLVSLRDTKKNQPQRVDGNDGGELALAYR